MNQQLFKRTSTIKVATMKIMDNFCYEWYLPQNWHFVVSKDEWDTEEGIAGKSMKNAFYEQQCPKRHL